MNLNPNDRQSYIEEFAASLEQGQRLLDGKAPLGRPIAMKAEGISVHVILMEDRVRITRKEEKVFLSQGFPANRDIPLGQIAEIQLKKAGTLSSGYIQFRLAGSAGAGSSKRDENMILFRSACEPQFEQLKAAIEARMSAPRTGPATPSAPALPPRKPERLSYIEELEQLASLRNRGVLTEEEFAAKKRQILGI